MLDWFFHLGGVVPLHYGPLHEFEGWLVPLVGIGPFVIMFVVIYFVRKRDADEEEDDLDVEGLD